MLTRMAVHRRKEYESIRHMEGSVQMLRLGPPASGDTATIVDAAVQTALTTHLVPASAVQNVAEGFTLCTDCS